MNSIEDVDLARTLSGVHRTPVRHAWGAWAMRLLRDVPHPNPAFALVLRAGADVIGEMRGREVRVSSDVLPDGSIVVSLLEGVDFEVIDARGGRVAATVGS